jgi:hypothetical protein
MASPLEVQTAAGRRGRQYIGYSAQKALMRSQLACGCPFQRPHTGILVSLWLFQGQFPVLRHVRARDSQFTAPNSRVNCMRCIEAPELQ